PSRRAGRTRAAGPALADQRASQPADRVGLRHGARQRVLPLEVDSAADRAPRGEAAALRVPGRTPADPPSLRVRRGGRRQPAEGGLEVMKDSLRDQLRALRLSGLTETLDVRLHEAHGARLAHDEFLELILQDELLVRDQRKIDRRVQSAAFRDLKTLEDFDWGFNPRIKRSQMYDLATGK